MAIVTRSGKGANLTANEVDNNFLELSGSIRGILTGTSNAATASYALTASYAANGGGGGGSSIVFGNSSQTATISRLIVDQATINNSFSGDPTTTGSFSVNLPAVYNYMTDRDFLPSTNGAYSLGGMAASFSEAWINDYIFLGSTILRSEDSTLLSTNPIITPAISANIANIGLINIIEDTISVDNTNTPADEYSEIPESILKIDSGLRILGSIYGTKYVLVNGNGTPEENAVKLQAAYDYAKELRASNPITGSADRYSVIISPGEYTFNTTFEIDTDGIDVISLTGGRDVVINIPITNDISSPSVWIQDVDYITVRGIVTQTLQFRTEVYGQNVLIENCKGGDFSFTFGTLPGGPSSHYGKGPGTYATFKNCEGGDYSFLLYTRNNYATFIDCKGGNYSFGAFANAGLNAFCTNCTAGIYSFGYSFNGNADGSYTNCTGMEGCFLSYSTGDGIIQSIITNCTAKDESFAFGGDLASSGKIINCIGGNHSFFTLSSAGGTNNGMVINCILLPGIGNASTFSSTGQGIIRNCINANGTLVNS